MTSTPKRQKHRDGSYTPKESPEQFDDPKSLKRKNSNRPTANNTDDDIVQAAFNNPYLAHHLPDQGYSPQISVARGPLRDFKRRATTAKQAEKAEDDPINAFTLQPRSQTYFNILKKRRDLPVHAQRYYSSASDCS